MSQSSAPTLAGARLDAVRRPDADLVFAACASPAPAPRRPPRRPVGEPLAHIGEQRRDLLVGQHAGEARHDRARLAVRRRQPEQRDVDDVLRIGRVDRRAQREIQPAEGQRPAALVAGARRRSRRSPRRDSRASRLGAAWLSAAGDDCAGLRPRPASSSASACCRRSADGSPITRRDVGRDRVDVRVGQPAEIAGHLRHRAARDAVQLVPAVAQIEGEALRDPTAPAPASSRRSRRRASPRPRRRRNAGPRSSAPSALRGVWQAPQWPSPSAR